MASADLRCIHLGHSESGEMCHRHLAPDRRKAGTAGSTADPFQNGMSPPACGVSFCWFPEREEAGLLRNVEDSEGCSPASTRTYLAKSHRPAKRIRGLAQTTRLSGNKRFEMSVVPLSVRIHPLRPDQPGPPRPETSPGKAPHNQAPIALARRRLTVVFAMLRDGSLYNVPELKVALLFT